MIIYSPLDGEALTSAVRSRPRHCFLMTQLGGDIPEGIQTIREAARAKNSVERLAAAF